MTRDQAQQIVSKFETAEARYQKATEQPEDRIITEQECEQFINAWCASVNVSRKMLDKAMITYYRPATQRNVNLWA